MENNNKIQPAPIHLLDREMAELIAAGEVVERPASIVKELLENAIDSGADSITLEIRNGGITFIRITDNGCGIRHEDVPTAFLRHATSKIREKQDLQSILTFGFRGEALAAVAAVSKVEMLTRTRYELSGTRYQIEGSQEICCEEAGCPLGTIITVRDLFYNTPARMKFLKRDAAETSAISGVVERTAISNPNIAFRFIVNGSVKLHTPGDSKQISALHTVFGREFSGALIPTEHVGAGVTVKGFIIKPTAARTNRSMQYFYVNGRYVRSKVCSAALDESYKGSIMVGKYPACVLDISLEPSLVDVNVHPAKIEVKFSDDKAVYEAIFFAVRSALKKNDLSPKIEMRRTDFKRQTSFDYKPRDFGSERGNLSSEKQLCMTAVEFRSHNPAAHTTEKSVFENKSSVPVREISQKPVSTVPSIPKDKREAPVKPFGGIGFLHDNGPVSPFVTSPLPENKAEKPQRSGLKEESKSKIVENTVSSAENVPEDEIKLGGGRFDNIRIIGELFETYLLIEQEDRLLMLDKHAAHERLLYEKLKEDIDHSNRQLLISPISISLSSEECGALLQNTKALNAIGFDVESFGFNTVLVREVPLSVEQFDITEVVTDLAQQLLKGRRQLLPELVDAMLHSIACKSAIKAHSRTPNIEFEEIIRLLSEHEDVKFCPHGRPIAVVLTKREIEKQFGRIVG